MISAILLCAGESKRMGIPKALLHTSTGKTFLQQALDNLVSADVDEIIVVMGAHQEIIRTNFPVLLKEKTLKIVFNPDYKSGMMSSIQTGIKALNKKSNAFLITLIDLPFLIPENFHQIIAEFHLNQTKLIRFQMDNHPAHPVLISTLFIPEIMNKPHIDKGCSFLFKKYQSDVKCLSSSVYRGGIDIDTPEGYREHFAL
jgi:molybdenum cofactor cytidylyltransferase